MAGAISQDCVLCGDGGPRLVCAACESRLPAPAPAGIAGCDRVIAAFAYRFPVDSLVARFKYAGDLAVGAWLARALSDRVASEPRPDILVPTPLAPGRLKTRGFNQAMEIARIVGRARGVPVATGLTRERDTTPQPGLGREERQRNLAGAFRATRSFADLDVAIVDDVVTTGATAAAMAAALRAAGARSVTAWACARTPSPGEDACSK